MLSKSAFSAHTFSFPHLLVPMTALLFLIGCDDGAKNEMQASAVANDITLCGNGLVDVASGEVCDDGDLDAGDGCNADCQVENSFVCIGEPSACKRGCRGWHSEQKMFGGKNYLQCDSFSSFELAKSSCESIKVGWHLVRIDNAAENNFIASMGGNEKWMGGSDRDEEGKWRWLDGEEFWQGDDHGSSVNSAYTNWGYISPTNDNVGDEHDCAYMWDGQGVSPGAWYNLNCTLSFSYVCEGPVCGDGVMDAGEFCDDGNGSDSDGCTRACRLPLCGDGVVNGGEQCDDGNTSSGDGCASACTFEPGFECSGDHPTVCVTHCGDGAITGTEMCDDDNRLNFDGCSASCQLEPGYQCQGEPSDCMATPGFCAVDADCPSMNCDEEYGTCEAPHAGGGGVGGGGCTVQVEEAETHPALPAFLFALAGAIVALRRRRGAARA